MQENTCREPLPLVERIREAYRIAEEFGYYAEAKERQRAAGGDKTDSASVDSTEALSRPQVRDQVAALADISGKTLHYATKIIAAADAEPVRWTQEALGVVFGVARNTVSVWFSTNVTIDDSSEPQPDARVKVNPAHRQLGPEQLRDIAARLEQRKIKARQQCRKLRSEGKTQKEAAKEIGVSEKTVKNWERQERDNEGKHCPLLSNQTGTSTRIPKSEYQAMLKRLEDGESQRAVAERTVLDSSGDDRLVFRYEYGVI